jgi:putative hemolysin
MSANVTARVHSTNPSLLLVSDQARVSLESRSGRFLIRTLGTRAEREEAFRLRYQVFQVEMLGFPQEDGEDCDAYDEHSDHLGVFDTRSGAMIATCRLNCSLFSDRFYSEQEFHCRSLLDRPETKLEIGRVCVHRDFRKGIIVMLLWKAIAEYMVKTDTQILFGCCSIPTLDPNEADLLYRYLTELGKLRLNLNVRPTDDFRDSTFEALCMQVRDPLNDAEKIRVQALLPSLCRSYFDIGCFIPGPPAFDRDFRCLDFLTVLEQDQLNASIRRKMLAME